MFKCQVTHEWDAVEVKATVRGKVRKCERSALEHEQLHSSATPAIRRISNFSLWLHTWLELVTDFWKHEMPFWYETVSPIEEDCMILMAVESGSYEEDDETLVDRLC